MKTLRFTRQFLRHPRQLGTVVESGRRLARRMAEEIDGSSRVIELGPGTGSVTMEILKRLPEGGRLTCIEINAEFCRCLREIQDSRLEVVNGDAAQCERYVDEADCIVSGLPLALFGRREKERVFELCERCGKYIQLQYTPVLGKEIRRHFADVKLKFVPLNLPPAIVYVCKGARGDADR
jgi:phospholipid N-methyltransferase